MSTFGRVSDDNCSLQVYEWAAVVIILFFVFSLTAKVFLFSYEENLNTSISPLYLADQEIEVRIEGAVAKPGTYSVQRGTSLGSLLDKAILLNDADTRKMKLDRKLRAQQVIRVPEVKKMTVYVLGAVENPGPVVIPKGLKLEALTHYVALKSNANKTKLQRKRILRDGETINIPCQ